MEEPSLYHTLPTPTSIRLMHLKAGNEDGKVECSLSIHEFKAAPEYEAVSYVWGVAVNSHPIFVNGIRVQVGGNLYSALRQLRPLRAPLHQRLAASLSFASEEKNELQARYEFAYRNDVKARMKSGEERVLWIDALCVDQQDFEEKGHQVRLMGSIYTQAKRVLIWLGPVEGDATNTLEILALASADRKRTADMEYLPVTNRDRRQAPPGYPPYTDSSWLSLIEFFDNEWFERIWVIQEAALARTAVAILGEFQCDWDTIGDSALWFCESNMMDSIYTTRPGNEDAGDLVRSYIRMLAASDIQQTRHKADTLVLTLLCSKFKCTLEIDRIYGILGLIEDIHITPDYSVPVHEVFRSLTMQIIKTRQDLLVLGQVDRTEGLPISQDVPSWTPQWPVDDSLFIFSRITAKDLYSAAGQKPLQILPHNDETHLCLKGIKVSKVTACGPVTESLGGVLDYPTMLAEMSDVMRIYEDAGPHEALGCYDLESESSDVVLANIFTAGQSRVMEPSSYDDDFENRAKGLRSLVQRPDFYDKSTLINPTTRNEKLAEYIIPTIVDMCRGRRYLKTEDGRYGLGPRGMEPEDEIVVLYGGMTVFVLRPVPTTSGEEAIKNQYQFVGEAYVHGIMKGEIVTQFEEGLRSEVDFDLI